MARTGQQLLTGFSIFLDDEWSNTGSSDGTATTIIDADLGDWADTLLAGRYFRITEASHSAIWEVRRCTAFAQSTGTATFVAPFTAKLDSTDTYEMHRIHPKRKFEAMDGAIIALSGILPQVVYNETITLDSISTEYAIPSAVRKGPILVQVEHPLETAPSWNFLTDPRGDSTTNWTLSSNGSETAATYSPAAQNDLLVPKYDDTCMRIVIPVSTAVTQTQTVGNMTNNADAGEAAARSMTFGMWVYAQTVSRVKLNIIDDSGAVGSSSEHGGAGWELLTVTATITENNATTLSAQLSISSGAVMTVFWNRGWFFYGNQMPSHFPDNLTFRVRRDDTTARILLPFKPQGKRQLRLIGSEPLSTLGSTLATQVTNSVEVDANTAEVLYAKAAEILFGKEALTTDSLSRVATRIRVAETRLADLERQWQHNLATGPRMKGPYE